MTCTISKPQQLSASLCLLRRWLAPEVLAGKSYDCASDVYSFGMILWEMLTWQVPWEELGPWQVGVCRAPGRNSGLHSSRWSRLVLLGLSPSWRLP